MNEKPRLKPTEKTCPLLRLQQDVVQMEPKCLGEKCALFVRIWKHRVLEAGQDKYPDSEKYHVYEGCGLIQHIPWAQKGIRKTYIRKNSE